MSIGWIDLSIIFQQLIVFGRFQIRIMSNGWRMNSAEWKSNLNIALNANRSLNGTCSAGVECAPLIDELASTSLRESPLSKFRPPSLCFGECGGLRYLYTGHGEKCDFIAEAAGTTVSAGRLQGKQCWMSGPDPVTTCYPRKLHRSISEPVGTLREFMRDKISGEDIRNVRCLTD